MLLQVWPVFHASNWLDVSDNTRMPDAASFSNESNALIVLMDSMTSDVFEEVVESTPALRQAFDGFLFFPDTVGAAPTTYLSMPTIHSARTYRNGAILGQFFDDAVGSHSVLTKVAKAGYRAILVNPIRVCPQEVQCFDLHSAMAGDSSSVRKEAMTVLDSVLFRVAPLGLKNSRLQRGRVGLSETDTGRPSGGRKLFS